jgi:hypothetical protein
MPHAVKQVLTVAAVVVLAWLLASAALAGKRHPRISIVDQSPVLVVGRGFAARERVTLRAVQGDRQMTKRVRATAAGSFRANLGDIDDSSCSAVVSVTVVGGAGSRATAARHVAIPPPCGIVIQP